MRFKDFGSAEKSARLNDDLVSVSSTSVADSAAISFLMETNKQHLEEWKTTESPTDDPENHFFTIKYKNATVGQIVLWRFKSDPKRCSISYWIGLDFCGRGLATAAVNLVTSYAFRDLSVHSIEAVIHTDNTASIRVAQKTGFQESKSLNNAVVTSPEAKRQALYTLTKK
jgi:RimJ/RimL family protein N-acetyltransferase